jgi:hypothetical protein
MGFIARHLPTVHNHAATIVTLGVVGAIVMGLLGLVGTQAEALQSVFQGVTYFAVFLLVGFVVGAGVGFAVMLLISALRALFTPNSK